MNNKIITIAASVAFCSCSVNNNSNNLQANMPEETHHQKEYPTEYKSISDADMPQAIPMKLEVMPLPNGLCEESRLMVYEDTILIEVHNDCNTCDFLVSLWDINRNKKIGDYVDAQLSSGMYMTLGRRPQFYNSVTAHLSGQYLYLRETKCMYSPLLDINAAINQKDDAVNMMYNPIMATSTYALLSSEKVVFYDQTFFDHRIYSNKDSVKEFAITDLQGNILNGDHYTNKRVNVGNVSGAFLASNPNRGRIIEGYVHSPKYKVLDSNLNVLKEITGPDADDDSLALMTDGKVKFFDFVDFESIYNISFTATDKHAIFQNARVHKNKIGKPLEPYGKSTAEFFMMDWNGNIVARYHCKGKVVTNISYSEKSKVMYLNCFENDKRLLYRTRNNIK